MAELTIGRLRGGFCVIWRDADGTRRRYQLKARTRAQAEGEARDVYLRRTQAPIGATVADLWAGYIHYLGNKPTAKTLGYTGKAVLAHFGHLRPDQITTDDCRRYTDAREAQGRKPGAIHTELGHLRMALNWAQNAGHIKAAPHIERPPKPDSDVQPIKDEDVAALVANALAPHARLAIILLLATGGRQGAILGLTWDRVDFERGVIDLKDPDGVTRKGRAAVPMNRMARAALEMAYQCRTTDWVVEYAGGPIKSMRTAYAAAQKRAGLSGIRIHQIRHTVAVRMLASGVDIVKVSQYLGHSNVQTTQRVYARFRPEHMADAAEILNFDLTRKVQ